MTMGWAGRAPVSATTASNNKRIVFTGVGLAALDTAFFNLTGVYPPTQNNDQRTPFPQTILLQVLNAVGSLTQALVSSAWTDNATKWLQAGVFNAAGSLWTIFGPKPANPQSDPLNLDDVTKAVADVIDNDDAQNAAAEILAVSAWLRNYVNISQDINAGAQPQNVTQTNDGFSQAVIDALLPTSNFVFQMSILKTRPEVCKYVIPVYILGIYLHLNLQRIYMALKGLVADPLQNSILYSAAYGYQGTLAGCDSGYLSLLHQLLTTYPLAGQNINSLDNYTGLDNNDAELYYLGRAAISKYLGGNRRVLIDTDNNLQTFMQVLSTTYSVTLQPTQPVPPLIQAFAVNVDDLDLG